jgi:hypothetical protein
MNACYDWVFRLQHALVFQHFDGAAHCIASREWKIQWQNKVLFSDHHFVMETGRERVFFVFIGILI